MENNFVKKNYVTISEGEVLSFPYDWRQTFDHPFEMARARPEAQVIKLFIEQSREEQQCGLEMLVLLLDNTFATRSQIERLLKIKGLDGTVNLDELLEKYLALRMVNKFTLGMYEMEHIPDDAFVIYCLDHASRHILSHFYRDDVAVTWKSTNGISGAERISKYLATNEFYLSLLAEKGEALDSFQPTVDFNIRLRDIRFSAAFRIMRGATPRDFILEAIRSSDIPTYWQKKCSEQISSFIKDKYWNRYFRLEPTFIFLAENLEQAVRVADICSVRAPEAQFRLTTDQEILKGLDTATFYKYDSDNNGLIPVSAGIFRRDNP